MKNRDKPKPIDTSNMTVQERIAHVKAQRAQNDLIGKKILDKPKKR